MEIASYVTFFLAGFGSGLAAPGKWRLTPLVFPLALALGAAYEEGVDGALLIRLVAALLVTAGGVLLGVLVIAAGDASGPVSGNRCERAHLALAGQ